MSVRDIFLQRERGGGERGMNGYEWERWFKVKLNEWPVSDDLKDANIFYQKKKKSLRKKIGKGIEKGC